MRRVLVVEPEERAAGDLADALRAGEAEVVLASDVEAGWRALIREPFDAVLCALDTPRGGAAGLLRRLAAEPPGPRRPRVHVIVSTGESLSDMPAPDGVVVRPLWDAAVGLLLEGPAPAALPRDLERLQALFALTTLTGDSGAGIDRLVARAARIFGVAECLAWGTDWRVSNLPDPAPDTAALCQLAAGVEATVWAEGASVLATPLGPPGEPPTGGLALVSGEPRRFDPGERQALALLGQRVGLELAWSGAHRRLLADHDQLREVALVDPLTGLWTRAAFESHLASELAAARRRSEALALAILDIRRLRDINDRYGHGAGDRALAHVARLVRANVRAQDAVGRFGGDEIAVLFVGADSARAQAAATKLCDHVGRSHLEIDGAVLAVAISAVVTDLDPDASDGETAFARALAAQRRFRDGAAAVVVAERSPETDEDAAFGADVAIAAGSTLGGMYRILHEINRGAMGVVYRAVDLGLGRPVAIKVLRTDLAQDRDLVARFRDEAAMLASLRHRNLVQVYSFGTQGDEVYFVMELVEGQSLSDVLDRIAGRGESLGLAVIAQIVEEIADALEAMHALGLIHRDVKPANILLDHINDRAVLVDVGVAKRREDRGEAGGTPGFAAPESFMDTQESSATDVYGLAATCYMMLVGEAPFGSGEVATVVERQLFERPPAPSSRCPGLSEAVDGVLLKALAAEQPARYGSAAAFAVAMASALKRSPAASGAPVAPRRRTTTPKATAPTAQVLPLIAPVRRTGMVRGVVFRVAHKLLVHHLGAPGVRRVAETHPELTDVLEPTLAPLSWVPVAALPAVLRCAGEVIDPQRLAVAVGRATANASLSRLLGADLSTLSPTSVIRAVNAWWPRYHTWSRAYADVLEATEASVELEGDADELLWPLAAGSLSRAAELAGAPRVTATTAGTRGGCRIQLRWG